VAPFWVGIPIITRGQSQCPFPSRERDDADVLLSFSRTWKQLAADMAAGVPRPDYQIGPPGREKEFAPLLLARAEMLERFAKDMKGEGPDDQGGQEM